MEMVEEIQKGFRPMPPACDNPCALPDFSPDETNPHPTFSAGELPADADNPSRGGNSQVVSPPRSVPASIPVLAPADPPLAAAPNPPLSPAPLENRQPAGLPSAPSPESAPSQPPAPPASHPIRTKDPFTPLVSPLAGSPDLIQAEIQSSITFAGPRLRRRRSHPPRTLDLRPPIPLLTPPPISSPFLPPSVP